VIFFPLPLFKSDNVPVGESCSKSQSTNALTMYMNQVTPFDI
jgi:hypothetical protein